MSVHLNLRNSLILSLVLVIVAVFSILLKMHFRPPETVPEVLSEMQKYQQKGRYSDAIAVGDKWTQDFPKDGSNDQVFGHIAFIYLDMARKDTRNKEVDIQKALEYRDKMLPTLSDVQLGWYAVDALDDAVSISELAGDIADSQRCTQYSNSLKLLARQKYLLEQKNNELSTKASDKFGYTKSDVQLHLKRTEESLDRISRKVEAAGCH